MAKSHEYRAPGAINREPGEKWIDFDARQREHRVENTPKPVKCKSRAKVAAAARKKIADRVDGFDRDDLGLSRD